MTRALLPPETEQFLLERIKTHEQLQVAIWLSRHPEESVSAETLASKLPLNVGETQEALLALVDTELVARSSEGPTRYWYAPAHPTLHVQMRFVGVLNDHYPADLLHSMALNAMARLRRAAQLACLVTFSADVRRALILRRRDDPPPSSRQMGDGAPASSRWRSDEAPASSRWRGEEAPASSRRPNASMFIFQPS